MQAIQLTDAENPRSLELCNTPTPQLQEGEVLVKVTAAGVNRADLVQAAGKYPAPKGESEIIGLECAGVIVDPGTTGRKEGEEVGCLLAGGGYAEYVAVPEGQLTPKPENLTLEELAGVVEVACTVWSNLGMLVGVDKPHADGTPKRVLIHGGSGGIGSFAIGHHRPQRGRRGRLPAGWRRLRRVRRGAGRAAHAEARKSHVGGTGGGCRGRLYGVVEFGDARGRR